MDVWYSNFDAQALDLSQRDSWYLEFDENIVPSHPNRGWNSYIGRTSARFRCTTCRRRKWNSNHVTVVFHMYLEPGQGTVKVKCLGQKCNNCEYGSMETPDIPAENIEILVENLMKEIRIQCYNEDLFRMERLPESLPITTHHEPSRCQACIEGICRQ